MSDDAPPPIPPSGNVSPSLHSAWNAVLAEDTLTLIGECLAVLSGAGSATSAARVCAVWFPVAAGATAVPRSLIETADPEVVRWSALSLLAQCGCRALVARFLPAQGPLSYFEADVWLESAQQSLPNDDWPRRISVGGGAVLSADLWDSLKTELAKEATGRVDLGEVAVVPEGEVDSMAMVVRRHRAARTTAAAIRRRLETGQSLSPWIDSPAAGLLPAWEQDYLRGMAAAQRGEITEARRHLEQARDLAPGQACVRWALASCVAREDAELALQLLDHPELTREIRAARAALQARGGRFDLARAELASASTAPGEALRCCGRQACAKSRRREAALRGALAAERGDWHGAEMAWRGASDGEKELALACELFVLESAEASGSSPKSWREQLDKQRAVRVRREADAMPMSGNALFFRTAALAKRWPARAAETGANLLREPAWLERERAAGGRRLLWLAELFARDGRWREAVAAVEAAGTPEMQRLLEKFKGIEEFIAPGGPQSGSPPGLPTHPSALPRTKATAISRPDVPPPVSHRVATALAAWRQLVSGEEPEPERLFVFVRARGALWVDECPYEPERAARRLLDWMCTGSRWDEALQIARAIPPAGGSWGLALLALVQVRHALALAQAGELERAEKELDSALAALRNA